MRRSDRWSGAATRRAERTQPPGCRQEPGVSKARDSGLGTRDSVADRAEDAERINAESGENPGLARYASAIPALSSLFGLCPLRDPDVQQPRTISTETSTRTTAMKPAVRARTCFAFRSC